MSDTVLVANRGEIAVRIIRAAKILQLKTVAIFADDDAFSLHVRLADEAYSLGNGSASETYLNIDKIIDIAANTGASLIHPGYGFLSENALFAKRVIKQGIKFVGPSPEVLDALGDKVQARILAQSVGIPVAPGSDTYVSSLEQAQEIADRIGYPIIIKAAFGGGGKGMEIVRSAKALEVSLKGCQSIAQQFFGRQEVFIEKYITAPRHVEIQFLADNYGNTIHLGDRECTIQRAHQKIIEEAPSFLPSEIRDELGEKVCKLAKKLKYSNAGTAEFLWKEGQIYFNEINPRIQVEHPVTEMITGIDLVVEQLKIALEEPLSYKQSDIKFNGHAIEYRINAEDPLHSFMPSSGEIEQIHLPGGNYVRFDSHVYQSYSVPLTYDSLLGKLIVWGENRSEAIERSKIALQELSISGVQTNISLHQTMLNTFAFLTGDLSTDFIEKNKIITTLQEFEKMKVAALLSVINKEKSPTVANKVTTPPSQKLSLNKWKTQGRLEQQRHYP
ncbi:MAG: acetyl-CoA carboxylase biotin carboxylase subunit [Candidatus Heimdallarchaeaceae archaeon]